MAHDIFLGQTKRNWNRAENATVGSIVLPEKQEKRLLNKIDDVRYDIRKTGNIVKIGLLSLSAALGLLAVSGMYKTARLERR